MRGRKRRKLEVSFHAERFVCGYQGRDFLSYKSLVGCQLSLSLRHLANVFVSSVFNLFTAKHFVARPNAVKNRIAMAPIK